MNQHQVKLSAEGTINTRGEFEILAITAGLGNGWEFTPEALRASLALWDGTSCFIDHHWNGPSIKDLAGICHSPQWDEDAQGIQVQLKATGPAGSLLTEIGKEILSDETTSKARIGFSADVVFTAVQNKVNQIIRVLSLDLVIDPARGGAFKRALNQTNYQYSMEVTQMQDPNVEAIHELPKESSPLQEQIQTDLQAVRTILSEQERIIALEKEAEQARKVRAQMCEYLLDSALVSSKLPEPVQVRLRKQFAGKVFEAAELTEAIDDSRKMVSDITGALVVQGPSRISGMFDTRDQLQAATDDLLGAERDTNLKGLKTHNLTGIRELYMMLTGDYDLHGGYSPDRIQLATTADFTGLVKNALNKIVVNTWDSLGRAGYDWWTAIVTQEHFNTINEITGTLVGTVGTLPTVAEGAEYTELAIGDSPEVASFVKYGGYIPLTLELIDRDETRKLKAYPRELAAAGLRKISALVAAIFTANANVGPTMADTGALFNATAVTTAGGHKNLLTTALAAAEWEVVSTAMYDQPMLIKQAAGYYGTGPKMAINPKYLLVPRVLQLTAMKILYPSLENYANIYSENLQRGKPGDVITVPEWTDATDWAAVADPAIAPAIYVGERFGIMPEIFIAGDEKSPAVFMNDEHRLKVRHFLACWVNDFRPLHKSNV